MESLVAASGYKFSKADRKLGKKKLKTPQGKENETNGLKNGVASSQAPSPVLPKFDEETMANFPDGKQEPLETLICKHCKKVVLKRTAKEHVALCLKSKQEKARKKKEAREAAQRAKERAERAEEEDEDDDDTKGGKNNGEGDDKKSKKRKAEDDDDREPKKKKTKKEEAKAKAPKPKGPVDVEKQCGVTLPNGAQCARSLTCKSHSMGAKRAVPGRSLPYDMLLAAYQKKNQARQQKAAIDANAPALLEEDLDPTLAGPVDSDEERDAVMSAIARSLANPQPLVTQPLVPRRGNYQLIRLRETLSNAMSGNRGAGLFSVPADAGRSAVPASATHDAFSHVIPASPAPTGVGMAQPGMRAHSRKTSIDVS
ncbi:SAGA complex subunit Sgf73 [Exophiala xenobiotica]|uniref:SAGA complex subunit Sgf73 n=1 Tax=Vermiconidia calcicola TaxID=1690605 RepID=A0AAV9Q730_9PEZI|nr:SAGA complex subunit Sgf73 [Exophiala xenobiotica]KAK5430568.1 SAGA complex subunit Sgf73 [Exophiala xenobiotica]KAK5537474.1 SAGA complex subunit Sgf73 [Vermiconidia calcicola]KAK5539284.1 SAGA complex subunit Sgf73 [Chaetothyriales sp. CCFEE 6169]